MYDVGPIRIEGFRQLYPISNMVPTSEVTRSVFDGWDNRPTTVTTFGPYNNYPRPAREPRRPHIRPPLLQLRLDQSLDAIRRRRGAAPRPLEEAQYSRPRRVGRACGSRHRVMI